MSDLAGGVFPIDLGLSETLGAVLKNAPSAFAITMGPAHTLVFANHAFKKLVGAAYTGEEVSIMGMLPEGITRVQSLLHRAWAGAEVLHDRFLGSPAQGNTYWSCTIWPLGEVALAPRGLVIELHKFVDPSPSLQREITERLLLATLQQTESADRAETSLARSEFLADAGQRLGMSLDPDVTRDTVAGITLPIPGTWCIVDVIEADGSITRLAMIHPNPEKQKVLRELARHWSPEPGDPFGGPAMQTGGMPRMITSNLDAALEAAAHSRRNLRLLRKLEIGMLLTVPMVSGERLLGAVTFVGDKPGRAYSAEEIRLAERLAARNAEALENARIYSDAIVLRKQAELATLSKVRFLGNISHELRTPLNAIVGYVEVIAAEIHGPVTPAQHADLERIRLNQQHILELVNELLAFVRSGTPRFNHIIEVPAHQAVASAVGLIENGLTRKSIGYYHDTDDSNVVALCDPERVRQILLNLLANAVKFTPRGGRITTRCDSLGDWVRISVMDNGIGIPASQLEVIFEPFVQVDSANPTVGGFGLGLAISRELARSMHGDLTVESTIGKGTRFTLMLPRARKSSSAPSR